VTLNVGQLNWNVGQLNWAADSDWQVTLFVV